MENDICLNGQYFDIMLLSKKNYCCSQIMTILALKDLGRDDADLVRAMGGLCHCMAYSEENCGVLSAGACLIALCTGKGSDSESPRESLPRMISELVEWFRQRTEVPKGDAKCDDMLLWRPDKRSCMTLILETYEKVLSILESQGLYLIGAIRD
jgi:hypothetical protein